MIYERMNYEKMEEYLKNLSMEIRMLYKKMGNLQVPFMDVAGYIASPSHPFTEVRGKRNSSDGMYHAIKSGYDKAIDAALEIFNEKTEVYLITQRFLQVLLLLDDLAVEHQELVVSLYFKKDTIKDYAESHYCSESTARRKKKEVISYLVVGYNKNFADQKRNYTKSTRAGV